jgi:hypothetical protein
LLCIDDGGPGGVHGVGNGAEVTAAEFTVPRRRCRINAVTSGSGKTFGQCRLARSLSLCSKAVDGRTPRTLCCVSKCDARAC